MSELLQLPPEFDLSIWHWVAAFLATFSIGLAKGGIKGVTVAFVALMAYVFGSKESTGLVLPMLIAGDILAVIYYNRHCQWKYIVKLMPWMIVGVLIGVWFGNDVPEVVFKRGMAFIILGSVIMMYWWDRKDKKDIPTAMWFSGGVGLIAGFTTMVGNLAGAVSNVYFLAIRLPKDQFIGTAAWLFFLINLFKVPFHIYVWNTISMDTLAFNLRLIPAILLGFLLGVKLASYFKDQQYRNFILAMTAIGAILIFFR
ncbi:MAG: sulfite exporter TauE/SafE family protein [Saprospiraceae bacterium]